MAIQTTEQGTLYVRIDRKGSLRAAEGLAAAVERVAVEIREGSAAIEVADDDGTTRGVAFIRSRDDDSPLDQIAAELPTGDEWRADAAERIAAVLDRSGLRRPEHHAEVVR